MLDRKVPLRLSTYRNYQFCKSIFYREKLNWKPWKHLLSQAVLEMKENKPYTPLDFFSWKMPAWWFNSWGQLEASPWSRLCQPSRAPPALVLPPQHCWSIKWPHCPNAPNWGSQVQVTGQEKLLHEANVPRTLLSFAAGSARQEYGKPRMQGGTLAATHHVPGVCNILGIYQLFSVAYTYISLKTTMIKITTLAIWITSNSRPAMPSLELNMHSCVGNGGFAASRLQTVITAWLADTNVLESRLSAHTENRSYPKSPTAPGCWSSPRWTFTRPGRPRTNVLMSILAFNTFS